MGTAIPRAGSLHLADLNSTRYFSTFLFVAESKLIAALTIPCRSDKITSTVRVFDVPLWRNALLSFAGTTLIASSVNSWICPVLRLPSGSLSSAPRASAGFRVGSLLYMLVCGSDRGVEHHKLEVWIIGSFLTRRRDCL